MDANPMLDAIANPNTTAETSTTANSMPLNILIYDGDCGFCTSTAKWAKQRLNSNYQVVPWQHLNLDDFGLSKADVNRSAYWVDSNGNLYEEHRCIAKVLSAMDRPWKFIGSLLTFGPINLVARAVYRLIAANRGRLSRLSAKFSNKPG
ncbi:MAG: DUF393 domain-containing protein [Acidimicrobiia bacterium]|nr:DUF393 domain-containing protein [Acidimicrobiia bacterium]